MSKILLKYFLCFKDYCSVIDSDKDTIIKALLQSEHETGTLGQVLESALRTGVKKLGLDRLPFWQEFLWRPLLHLAEEVYSLRE